MTPKWQLRPWFVKKMKPTDCQNGTDPGRDGSESIAEKFGRDAPVHRADARDASRNCAKHVPVVLMKRYAPIDRTEFRHAPRTYRQTYSTRDRAVPREHKMGFVPNELEIVETHFFQACIEVAHHLFEMIAPLHVIERINETRVRCIKDIDIVQYLGSAKMVHGK